MDVATDHNNRNNENELHKDPVYSVFLMVVIKNWYNQLSTPAQHI